MNIKAVTHYIYELFQLKRLRHSGFYKANVVQPDSVAEHALLAAQIGYLIASAEGADADKVLKMLVFHDNPETRVGDMDKVVCRYIRNKVEIEKHGLRDQVDALPKELGTELIELFDEMEEKTTPEAIIVKDADYLEQAFQARIFQSQGNEGVQNWLDNIKKVLKTKTAQKLYTQLVKTSPNEWFIDLKYFSRNEKK